MKLTQGNKKKKNRKNNEDNLKDLQDTTKLTNVYIIEVTEEKRRRKAKSLFEEIMDENYPNLGKETDMQIQETQRHQLRWH